MAENPIAMNPPDGANNQRETQADPGRNPRVKGIWFSPDDDEHPGRLRAFHAEGQARLFVIYPHDSITIPGHESVYAAEYMKSRVYGHAKDNLEAFVIANIGKRDMYRREGFWKEALRCAGKPITPDNIYLPMGDPLDGTVRFVASHASFHTGNTILYNWVDDIPEVTPRKWRGPAPPVAAALTEGKAPPTLAEYVYLGMLDQVIALEHHNRGEAEPAYEELCRINRYLEDKRSFHVLFPDGRSYQTRSWKNKSASSLMQLRDGVFIAPDYGFLITPPRGSPPPVGIRYRGVVFTINTEVFTSLPIIPDDPRALAAREREAWEKELLSLIPSGTEYQWYSLTLRSRDGFPHSVDSPTPIGMEDLLQSEDALRSLAVYFEDPDLTVTFYRHTIGAGVPADMPQGVYEHLCRYGRHTWHGIEGYREHAEKRITPSPEFIYENLKNYGQMAEVRRRKLDAWYLKCQMTDHTTYTLHELIAVGALATRRETAPALITSEREAFESAPAIALQSDDPEGWIEITVHNYTIGTGGEHDILQDLLELATLYGLDDLEREGIANKSAPLTYERYPETDLEEDGPDDGPWLV